MAMSIEKVETSGQELPFFMMKSSTEAYGWRIITVPGIQNLFDHVERIRKFKIRDGDVLLAAYPKCGTHWLWEVTQMLLRQTTEYEKRPKEQVMLESLGGLERSESETSPRILNSHNVFVHLPQEIVAKKTKIIHVIRNPKDMLVSMFWFTKTIQGEGNLTFSTLLEAAIADNLSFPSQLDYLHQMSEFQQNHPDHPIQHIYYEEMKKEPEKIIKELARFLNVPASDEFCQTISNACSFQNMKKIEETEGKDYPKEIKNVLSNVKGKLQVYRKGIIGDWKNQFTVAQNELFDDFINTYTKNQDMKFKFIYE